LAVALTLLRVDEPARATPEGAKVSPASGFSIDASVPGARVWLGERELGTVPVSITREELGGQPIVVIAPFYEPTILDAHRVAQSIDQGHDREMVELTPVARPDRAVFVHWPRTATARLASSHRALGIVPGVLLVPDPAAGEPPIVEIVEGDRVALRVSSAHCDPVLLCVIDGG
jgi:hypothetical protein